VADLAQKAKSATYDEGPFVQSTGALRPYPLPPKNFAWLEAIPLRLKQRSTAETMRSNVPS